MEIKQDDGSIIGIVYANISTSNKARANIYIRARFTVQSEVVEGLWIRDAIKTKWHLPITPITYMEPDVQKVLLQEHENSDGSFNLEAKAAGKGGKAKGAKGAKGEQGAKGKGGKGKKKGGRAGE